MPDIQKIKLDFQSLFGKSKKNPEMPEEELRTLFTKSDILENLGYGTIGKDIRLELFIKGKKSDIACIDDYGNVVFVVEFKKPSDSVDLKEHFNQLWDRYVKPLRADFGALINGYELILYRRIGENNNLELRVNLSEITDKDCELIYKLLKKPDYSLTQVKDILNYLNKFSAPESRVYLTTDAAREHFFENFKLEVDSIFGELLKNTIKLFDYEYSRSKFLTSAYDFWRKSYAKKPDKVPESWKKLLKGAGLSTGEEDLYKFMFCLETTYALFTRLILAKACEDYNFQGIDFSEFIESEIKGSERRGGTFLVMWGVLVMRLIRKMRRDLVESVFEEDLFYWWTDDFEGLQNNIYADQRSYEEALMDFSRALAKVLYALYKFDFSKIIGDPLGDLYQKYFDRETRKALGEFYTPKEVVEYIVDAVDYRGRGIVDKRLLDPACGSGTFLVDALKRYLVEAAPLAEEKGWDFVLSKLCNEYHIVGFDIHPFATIMAQIQFMLVLIPKYKEALKKNPNFVLKRLPIFRTDSLIDESKSEAMTLSMFEGGRSVSIKITLPVRTGDRFVDAEVIMPFRGEAISEKTGLLNIPEYFAALQALFDTVKEAARAEPEKQVIEKDKLENSLKLYLPNKDWSKLAGFFMPYGRYFLDTIKKLKNEYGDGRLVKSIEDIILAGLLKNYVEYDFVVGNPPYVRVQTLSKESKEKYSEYETAIGNFDIYIPFLERGIVWLNRGGHLGYICPNRFTTVNYGKKIRKYILEKSNLLQFIDFKDTGVFKDALNYPAIVITQKAEGTGIVKSCRMINKPDLSEQEILDKIRDTFAHIKDSEDYLFGGFFDVFGATKKFCDDGWYLMPSNEKRVFDKTTNNSTLSEFSESTKEGSALFEGSSTGAKQLFVVKMESLSGENHAYISLYDGSKYKLEKEILKPYVEDAGKWYTQNRDIYLIFPYAKINNEYKLIPEDILIQKHPLTWEYLLTHKKTLTERKGYGEKKKEWYSYSAPRSLNYYEAEKMMVQGFSVNSTVSIDFEGNLFFGPDIYGFRIKNEHRKQSLLFLGILNSNITNFFTRHVGVIHGSGYYKFEDRFVKNLPIHLPHTHEEQALASQITARVEQILSKVKSGLRAARFPEEYIKEYRARGEEFDAREIVFNTNHKELVLEVERSLDNEFLIKIKGASPIVLDSESKAEYVKAALAGRKVSKDEKIQILIPRSDALAKEAVTARQKDLQETQGIAALEGEINELVYKLYGLDENDRKIIEEFLSKF